MIVVLCLFDACLYSVWQTELHQVQLPSGPYSGVIGISLRGKFIQKMLSSSSVSVKIYDVEVDHNNNKHDRLFVLCLINECHFCRDTFLNDNRKSSGYLCWKIFQIKIRFRTLALLEWDMSVISKMGIKWEWTLIVMKYISMSF